MDAYSRRVSEPLKSRLVDVVKSKGSNALHINLFGSRRVFVGAPANHTSRLRRQILVAAIVTSQLVQMG